MKFVQPEGWNRPQGYSNAVQADGPFIFLAGQVGWNAREQFDATDFLGQARQALLNIATILRAAGSEPAQLVRLTWFVTDKAEYLAARQGLAGIYREIIGPHFPAMSVVEISGLIEDGALLEIEATAVGPKACGE